MAFPDRSDGPNESAADETTALLAASANLPPARPAEDQLSDTNDKPLPKKQIFFLCYARLVEPIAYFSIFPFINQMIQETGNIDEKDVGFYSGLIVSNKHPLRIMGAD